VYIVLDSMYETMSISTGLHPNLDLWNANNLHYIANTQYVHAADGNMAMGGGASGIHFKPTKSLFRPHYTKKETQNTYYRNKLMLKSLPTAGTEPAVKVVTQQEHRNYQ